MSSEPVDPSLPLRLREFHERLPLAGEPRNAVLALPDDQVLYPPRYARAGAGALGIGGS